MIVSIIGLGLIGGSVGLRLKSSGYADEVYGVDLNDANCDLAEKLGLVDKCVMLEQAVAVADLLIVAIPVNSIVSLLPNLLDKIGDKTTVIDLGSTKEGVCASVLGHAKRKNFVAAHPIAGTEDSGPEAAFDSLFEGKKGILCDKEDSQASSYQIAKEFLGALGMEVIEMNSKSHDLHIAYVSHISHISSFVLGQTVLEIEKDESSIFNLAGSGLESTVRLAKSSPRMWAPIFKENKKHISDALGAYIDNLAAFKKFIDTNAEEDMVKCMENANEIRRVLDGLGSKINVNKDIKEVV